ncbi:MAG: pirin family protein [Moraxellaceae bacterium]|nr:pirin family protein [Pseudomonadales bacterium]MCP5173645.1 pirin family protein [Moraxellaceae bacterium]MCP5178139.1 pirin family protein [Moraxellaceae bacterium]
MLAVHANSHRGQASYGWLDARYSFSFASWYDPRYMGVASLRVINEDKVKPLTGFAMHSHSNMEILTYILSGEISHQDSMGNKTTISAGECQLMSAGRGVSHSEKNQHPTQTLHLLQIWLVPNQENTEPRYQQVRLDNSKGLVQIASPNEGEGLMHIKQDAAIYRLKFETGQTIKLPHQRAYGYLHLINGQGSVQNINLNSGDALISKDEQSLEFVSHNAGEALWFDLA